MDVAAVKDYFTGLQDRIVAALEALDGGTFRRDAWTRAEGGGGVSRLIEDGALFERGGVNFSHVMGTSLPPSASAGRPELAGRGFEALGVSLVLHPRNPYVPTVHMNVRCFVATKVGAVPQSTGANPIWWFGGGMDLTPYYGFEEDAIALPPHLQGGARPVRARGSSALQGMVRPLLLPQAPRRAARRRRHLLRRPEHAGLRDLLRADAQRRRSLSSTPTGRSSSAGATLPYGERERDFQAYRRGRYVEFNLVYDRGTLFGLQSGGRTESILMSLPPVVKWRYDWRPEPGTPEARLYEVFLVPRDWA